jgi:hypothetical protein
MVLRTEGIVGNITRVLIIFTKSSKSNISDLEGSRVYFAIFFTIL